jgi:hypothetical protein
MTLHLLKSPANPLAIQMMRSAGQSSPPIAVLLSASGNAPPLPGITMYQVAESLSGSKTGESGSISYARLVDLIFSADKVIAW